MVRHETEFWAQDGDKPLKDCVRFAMNPNFVAIPDDFEFGSGYHCLDDKKGDGYKITPQGQIFFPMVYYMSIDGFSISCTREYVSPGVAKQHLLAGTADILGRRVTVFGVKRRKREYRYFIRRYSVKSCKSNLQHGRRAFKGHNYKMENESRLLDLGAVVLTTFVGPRPKGFIVQHDGVVWDNALESLRWIPRRENYLKENCKPE